MIVHSSALLAILLDEPCADIMLTALLDAERPAMAATDWLNVAMLMEEKGGRLASLKFDEFFRTSEIEIAPVDQAQAEIARNAWRHFGRHRHSARLEYGDCLAYALAKTRGEPLLYAEPGFTRTDILAAV
jgi:ribonuclease VapC